jgi:ABC-type microcin C transport system permease subunit YejE
MNSYAFLSWFVVVLLGLKSRTVGVYASGSCSGCFLGELLSFFQLVVEVFGCFPCFWEFVFFPEFFDYGFAFFPVF